MTKLTQEQKRARTSRAKVRGKEARRAAVTAATQIVAARATIDFGRDVRK